MRSSGGMSPTNPPWGPANLLYKAGQYREAMDSYLTYLPPLLAKIGMQDVAALGAALGDGDFGLNDDDLDGSSVYSSYQVAYCALLEQWCKGTSVSLYTPATLPGHPASPEVLQQLATLCRNLALACNNLELPPSAKWRLTELWASRSLRLDAMEDTPKTAKALECMLKAKLGQLQCQPQSRSQCEQPRQPQLPRAAPSPLTPAPPSTHTYTPPPPPPAQAPSSCTCLPPPSTATCPP
jgi:hypothetical protein